MLFVFAPAISVAAGVFVANFIVPRSPVAKNEGVEVEGGEDYALIIVRARASEMLSGLCEHDKTVNTETMILTFVPVVGVAYFPDFFERERYDFIIL